MASDLFKLFTSWECNLNWKCRNCMCVNSYNRTHVSELCFAGPYTHLAPYIHYTPFKRRSGGKLNSWRGQKWLHCFPLRFKLVIVVIWICYLNLPNIYNELYDILILLSEWCFVYFFLLQSRINLETLPFTQTVQ